MMQPALFDPPTAGSDVLISGSVPEGLAVIPHFVSKAEAAHLLELVDDDECGRWIDDLRRRVKHFGYRYNYKMRALRADDRVGDIPAWARELGERLVENGYFDKEPEQLIVNEYLPGQGISPHVDRDTCFGPTVVSVSLGSNAVLDLTSADGDEVGAVLLPELSAIVLRGPARYAWKHGIAARKRDSIQHVTFERKRRVSLTFRTVILDH